MSGKRGADVIGAPLFAKLRRHIGGWGFPSDAIVELANSSKAPGRAGRNWTVRPNSPSRCAMSVAMTIDARGLRCPLPALRLRKVLLGSPAGTIVRILTDDPVAAIDIPHFCREEGYDLVAERPIGTGLAFTVEKA